MYREFYCYSFESGALTPGAGTVFSDVLVHLDPDADFEVLQRIHVSTSDLMFIRYSDDSFGRYQQNVNVDLRGVSGRSLALWNQTGTKFAMSHFPYTLPCPYRLAAGCTVTASFADASGLANSIRETWLGAKIRDNTANGKAPWDREWNDEVPFTYTTGPLVVAASGTTSFAINIGMDASFLIEDLKAIRTGGATVTIKDGSTDRQWMDRAVHIDNLFGSAIHPHRLLAKRFVSRGSSISITISDISAASNTVELIFGGTKLFGAVKGIDDVRPVLRG